MSISFHPYNNKKSHDQQTSKKCPNVTANVAINFVATLRSNPITLKFVSLSEKLDSYDSELGFFVKYRNVTGQILSDIISLFVDSLTFIIRIPPYTNSLSA